MDVKDNETAKAALDKVLRHLPKSKKVKFAWYVKAKQNQGFDYVAIMDLMASRIGADVYNDVDHTINTDAIVITGLEAWKALRTKPDQESTTEEVSSTVLD